MCGGADVESESRDALEREQQRCEAGRARPLQPAHKHEVGREARGARPSGAHVGARAAGRARGRHVRGSARSTPTVLAIARATAARAACAVRAHRASVRCGARWAVRLGAGSIRNGSTTGPGRHTLWQRLHVGSLEPQQRHKHARSEHHQPDPQHRCAAAADGPPCPARPVGVRLRPLGWRHSNTGAPVPRRRPQLTLSGGAAHAGAMVSACCEAPPAVEIRSEIHTARPKG